VHDKYSVANLGHAQTKSAPRRTVSLLHGLAAAELEVRSRGGQAGGKADRRVILEIRHPDDQLNKERPPDKTSEVAEIGNADSH
jgi:hypothetical protein